MWDLVTKLFWLPFDIMQRVSQRVLLIGRNVYGSMFGTRPAIKPPPTSPPPERSPSPQSTVTVTPTPSTSDISMKMDSALFPSALDNSPACTIEVSNVNTSLSSSLLSATAGITDGGIDVEQGISNNVVENNTKNSIVMLADCDMDMQVTFSSKINNLETECISAATVPVTHALAVENGQGRGATIALVEMTNEMDVMKGKRLREKEKRKPGRQAKTTNTSIQGSNDSSNTTTVAGDSAGTGPPSKKEKTSEQDSQGKAKSEASVTEEDKPKRKNKRRAKKKGKKDPDQGNNTEGEDMGVPSRPNFFIAIQISDKNILSKVSELQQKLSEKTLSPPWHNLTTTEIYRDAMIPVQKLHFTLHVMHLKGEEELQKAQQVLKECWSEVRQDYIDDPMDLTIEGLGHFKNNVLFAQIKEEKHILRLEKLSTLFQAKFEKLKIPGDPRPFKPHMTIAKISRSNKLHKKKIRVFPPEMWSGYEEAHFGVQHINSLQLLCMVGEDKLTGYYRCYGQQYFQDPLLLMKSPSSEVVTDALSENQVNMVPSSNNTINDHQRTQSQSDNSSSSEAKL
ncbi:unnamed protein product [Orchesella dallaii]|uniref:A-kinase anchor protein 7-like phosphoesterase domain-containing protein n=1 Tax=Orchesella dallaii TaxID=48710 RepID=A0ABP1REP0_9HEXA